MAHEKNHDYHILNPSIWPFLGGGFGLRHAVRRGALDARQRALDVPDRPRRRALRDVRLVGRRRQGKPVGDHTPVVRIGLRYGFILFIMSEVMFFAAWFWSFFKHAMYPMDPGGMSPAVDGVWPPAGIETFDPWHLPLINTLILLCSGAAATWAHHALVHENNRKDLVNGLILASSSARSSRSSRPTNTPTRLRLLGQHLRRQLLHGDGLPRRACDHRHDLPVRLPDARAAGHFTQDKHIGFEAAAWYWHFVDVVWLFLFAAIYIWGG
jgi:cytochrome c oxidase subunit 3